MERRWRIELLGRFRARWGEYELSRFPRQKAADLLAYLAYYPARPSSREALIELLWPEIDPELGRQNLRNALHALRQQLEAAEGAAAPLLVTDRSGVALRPEAFTTDVQEFTAALQAAQRLPPGAAQAARLEAAVALYGGELLPECFEAWALSEREALQQQYLQALQQLVAALEAAGDLPAALSAARQAVAADPLREEAHYDLMRLLAATGQPSACLRQYQELERVLREELGETPTAAARALAEELREGARTLLAARSVTISRPAIESQAPESGEGGEGGPTRPPPPRPSEPAVRSAPPPAPTLPRLPVQLTRFFGREGETTQLMELLAGRVTRLVTLTGPGGSGKTRLAIAVAGRLQELFGEAVAFVALADLADAGRLGDTIADALGLERASGAEPWEQVVEHLRGHPWLLVLDNFEQLVESGAAQVRALLGRVETVSCLVTSRQRLGLSGEQEFALLPLATPRRSDPLERLQEYPSVQLFVDRARAARAGFHLTEANAAAVAELCDRLEGLPLALELAAARVGVLAPEQMLTLLAERFQFLVSRQRDLPHRHQTLRAAIDSSYQLLDPGLQRFFARLSVFRGGWTLAAARAVCGEGIQVFRCRVPAQRADVQDEHAPTPESTHSVGTRNTRTPEHLTLDYLEQLRDCSLIGVEEQEAEGRYRLLETLREYGWEQLTAAGELDEVRKRHRDWYLQLAEAADAYDIRPVRPVGRGQLAAEIDNLRAALAWCREEAEAHPDGDAAEVGLRLAAALWWLWMARGYVAEGRQWLEEALARSDRVPAAIRARALQGAASMTLALGDRARALALRQAADQEYRKVLTLARESGDRAAVARTLWHLAYVTVDHEDPDARWAYGVEARQLFQELGDAVGLAEMLAVMAPIAVARGEEQAARALLEERLTICRELADSEHLIHALGAMGHLARDEGDYARARSLYQESLVLRREMGHLHALAQSLEDLAALAGREGQAERAIRLLGAGEAFCETLGARPPVAIAAEYERTVSEGRATLGESAFAAAWAAGRAMPLEQALEFALEGGSLSSGEAD